MLDTNLPTYAPSLVLPGGGKPLILGLFSPGTPGTPGTPDSQGQPNPQGSCKDDNHPLGPEWSPLHSGIWVDHSCSLSSFSYTSLWSRERNVGRVARQGLRLERTPSTHVPGLLLFAESSHFILWACSKPYSLQAHDSAPNPFLLILAFFLLLGSP